MGVLIMKAKYFKKFTQIKRTLGPAERKDILIRKSSITAVVDANPGWESGIYIKGVSEPIVVEGEYSKIIKDLFGDDNEMA